MKNNITDRVFWEKYWQNYVYKPAPNNMFFDKYLHQNIIEKKLKSFIEIGGFPGTMSIYFFKKYALEPTLLDYYIDKEMVARTEEVNNVPLGTIKCIESDFFEFNSVQKYDVVFSNGFIEHFNDTIDVIRRHVDLLNPQGYLVIVLPNFRGLNGFIQKTFDRDNFAAHNLESMKIDKLNEIVKKMNLKDVQISYTSKPMLWIEPKQKVGNALARIFVKMLSYLIKIFPFKGRFLSPYIVIIAKG